jgi:hypothetical protein
MRKSTSLMLLALIITLFSKAQNIVDMVTYYKLGGVRIVTLLDDNSLWWYAENTGWSTIPKTGIADKKIVKIGAFVKTAAGGTSRVIAVADDNSIWWYADDKDWEQASTTDLPANYTIKIFTPYFKPTAMGWSGETRFFLAQNDNSMWWFDTEKWKPIGTEGLPQGYDLKFVKSYQKYGMMGSTETRYVSVLKDNTIWWSAGKKWQQVEAGGLTPGKDIKLFDVYMKYQMMGSPEGRLVSVLSDNSFWYYAVGHKNWEPLKSDGLPTGYKVKHLQVYQKFALGESGRIVITLEDNTIWWFAESKGWEQIDTKKLGSK